VIAALSAYGAKVALYVGVGLLVGMVVREYARAFVTAKLGDPTPRLWGRLTLNPKAWFDPFGSGFIPGILLVLWASFVLMPQFAYGKPAALDPNYLKRGKRDVALASLAGPVANLALAAIAGVVMRLTGGGSCDTVGLFLRGDPLELFMYANLSLCVMHLMPLPGLDGARLVGLLLAPHPREVYRNLDHYLPLFVLLVFFLLGGIFFSIVGTLTDALRSIIAGSASC
jgi:Zn-dependent protease